MLKSGSVRSVAFDFSSVLDALQSCRLLAAAADGSDRTEWAADGV